uniref:Uncharacterized protein n=1 Tax=Meloidogyne enterolobii TaxID=390850 RepID=A0A6V7U3U8_MELEN|nr:unnamed protein product [Meloidogyne enterolobii]
MKERRKAFRENEKRELILVVEHFLRILEGLVRQKEKKEGPNGYWSRCATNDDGHSRRGRREGRRII